MRIWAAVVVGGLMIGSAAPAVSDTAQQFNLVCNVDYSSTESPSRAFQKVYRIDLTAMRWCVDACQGAFPIKSVTADKIIFDETDKRVGTQDGERSWHEVNRVTGEVSSYLYKPAQPGVSYSRPLRVEFKGKCEPAPFTGLPTPKF